MKSWKRLLGLFACVLASMVSASRADEKQFDVVVYGGTSGGIAAAVQVKRMGGTVAVIEPSSRIGGLTTGGLGQTDIGNKAAVGGISREFYQRVFKFYANPDRWKWQKREQYRDGGQTRTTTGEDTMWTFEPSAALLVMQDFVREYDIPVVMQNRLDRTGNTGPGTIAKGVKKEGGKVVAITLESGETYRGKVFIDATYEGDLLAGAGVRYIVGREANAAYQETLSGVQVANSRNHQLQKNIDPYVKPGDRNSGLLPGIDPAGPGTEGGADHRVQAYCFRMCLTDHPDNRIPFAKPEGYDPLLYELMLRNFEAGEKGMPWINSDMPNRKTDTNNRTGFSTDFIGQNYDYPEASYAQREKIVARHLQYQQGLMWTLANHPRVPENVRKEISRWGMSKDEFTEGNGWQEQLYIREARRMIGATVMTQHYCQGRTVADDAVGMAAYTMDSHNTQRYVDQNGHARNEGNVEVGGFPPYPISYGSITPKQDECENLLVPVCLSATHIAFGSIRMEPVFMVLGQSAATAAMQSIEAQVPVQKIDYAKLQARLLADKQVLAWTGPKTTGGVDPKSLPGIVIDDSAAELKGFSNVGQVTRPFIGAGYRHDADQRDGEHSAIFKAKLPKAGRYEVRVAYPPNPNRATNVPVKVRQDQQVHTVKLNQQKPLPKDGFATIGTYEFAAGEMTVEITNAGVDGFVIVDAVQILEAK